jgi:serine phosphatase RsbU (regulator of sigma subunit)
MLETEIAAAKIGKYATGESGDTLEIVERPHGGISVVLADGQRSGRPAKAISNVVVRKAIALLAEGVRDGAAARAAHDYLYTHRGGKVSATLNILSVDLITQTIVISQNSDCPVWVATGQGLRCLDSPSQPVGIYPMTRPDITELPVEAGMVVLIYTDGVAHAGRRRGTRLDVEAWLREKLACPAPSAQEIADSLLSAAIDMDDGRPSDDISVLVLAIHEIEESQTRRLSLSFPLTTPARR